MQQNSLRWLADHYLQQTIQRGAHDSKEDAIAALRLVNLKLQQGPFFGMSHTAEAHNLVDVLHEQGRYNLLPCFKHDSIAQKHDLLNINNKSGFVGDTYFVTYGIRTTNLPKAC